MSYSVSASEFGKMSEQEKAEAVRKLARGAFESSNGRAGEIDDRIDALEDEYGFDSRELIERLEAGKETETEAISEWLWLLNFRRERLS